MAKGWEGLYIMYVQPSSKDLYRHFHRQLTVAGEADVLVNSAYIIHSMQQANDESKVSRLPKLIAARQMLWRS